MSFSFQTPFFFALIDSAQHTPDAAVLLTCHVDDGGQPSFYFDVSHSQSPTYFTTAVHDCSDCCWDYVMALLIHVVGETSIHYHFTIGCEDGSKRELVYQFDWQGLHDMKLADVKYVLFSDEFTFHELYA